MIRWRASYFWVAAGLILVATASAPAFPQEVERPRVEARERIERPLADDGRTDVERALAGETAAQNPEGQETVESILREQEQLLRGKRFSYDPSGRRDPFRSLYEHLAFVTKGPRPKGIAGMLVTEVDLVGTVSDNGGGDVAFFIGSDNKGYFLKVGDDVYDGTLIAVDPNSGSVTFRQQVDDPRLIKPYRDVVKQLVPLEDMANE